MKKIISFIILILCFSYELLAGSGWREIQTGRTDNFTSVSFINKDTGWLCGDNGIILKTEDGGESWTKQDSGIAEILWKIQFVDEKTGWCCGSAGLIFKTSDGGINWNQMHVNENYLDSYYDLHFINVNIGWTCGTEGKVYKTTDGGDNWFAQSFSTHEFLTGIHFVDSLYGWASGTKGLGIRTSNGGETWDTMNTRATGIYLLDVFFLDRDSGYFAGYSYLIIGTTDGGSWWAGVEMNPGGGFSACFMRPNSLAWFVGDAGKYMMQTSRWDWTPRYSISNKDLYDVFFIDDNVGWIVGYNGAILKTTNGGMTGVDFDLTESPPGAIAYPNPLPAGSAINIKLPAGNGGAVDVRLYSSLGEECAPPFSTYLDTGAGSFLYKPDSELAAGVYYLVVRLNGGRQQRIPLVVAK